MPELSTPITIAISIAVGLLSVLCLHMIKAGTQSYEAREKLLTGAEINFFKHLQRAIGDAAMIFCMVRMADILTVKKSLQGKRLKQKIAPIAQKHLDFVLVDKEMNILAAIELNDKTHNLPDRKARDIFVRKTLKSAGIPLIEIPAARTYKLQKIRDVIADNVPSLLVSMSIPDAVKNRKEEKLRESSMNQKLEVQQIVSNNVEVEAGPEPTEFIQHERKKLSEYHEADAGSSETPLSPFERAEIKAREYERNLN
jgi:hypothetical protein